MLSDTCRFAGQRVLSDEDVYVTRPLKLNSTRNGTIVPISSYVFATLDKNVKSLCILPFHAHS